MLLADGLLPNRTASDMHFYLPLTILPPSDHGVQRLTIKPLPRYSALFPAPPSSSNIVIGRNGKKGGHAFDDDKHLKRFIILILLSPFYVEGFLTGHVAGCVFDLPLAHGEVVK